MGKFFTWIGTTLGVSGAIALYIGGFIGWAYWMWMSIHLSSFTMFIAGLLGPIAVPASLLGMWSFLFGVPLWLFNFVT
jgi:hypothetical protein